MKIDEDILKLMDQIVEIVSNKEQFLTQVRLTDSPEFMNLKNAVHIDSDYFESRIKENRELPPIIKNNWGRIYDGYTRVTACLRQGRKFVPAINPSYVAIIENCMMLSLLKKTRKLKRLDIKNDNATYEFMEDE